MPLSNDQKIKQNLINFIKSFKLDDANMIINKFNIQQMEVGLSKKKKEEKK